MLLRQFYAHNFPKGHQAQDQALHKEGEPDHDQRDADRYYRSIINRDAQYECLKQEQVGDNEPDRFHLLQYPIAHIRPDHAQCLGERYLDFTRGLLTPLRH